MNKHHTLKSKPFLRKTLLKQGISLVSGLGILTGGMGFNGAIASTETLVIPENPTPTVKPEPASPSPIEVPKASPYVPPTASSSPKPVQRSTSNKPNQPKVSPKPSVSQARETSKPKVKLSAPKILDPQTSKNEPPKTLKEALTQHQNIQLSPSVTTAGGQNSYIDTKSYGNSSPTITRPNKVVLTERSTGCQTVAQNGQLSGGNCGAVATQPSKPKVQAPRQLASRRVTLASRQTQATTQVAQTVSSPQKVEPLRLKRRPISSEQVVNLQPIQRQGLSIALEPLPRYNRAASMYGSNTPQARKTDLIFPLPVVATMTSAFGWRTHPISGTQRMHNGTDFGAPLGTPVLAAYGGEVSHADWSGGYGLMVVLRHLEGTQESRYAHLSDIYVQPGEWVEQGTVIGRLGSTGYSTGPHLHFEWRHLTEQGWVAVDAGLHLEYAMDNLMRAMQYAQESTTPEG
ncbi:M23 family metallopeptidase [Crocosphaera chwakensis]|uniref:Lysostaphin n=1 Tax=Crocosphaera chwakensis CCY0110 TaxID=391612 RepID=A3IND1_9CHRO|nr:peptidoglycan DD-metalloendopeptidase family protein [Crocosphaera chwakensis]EAZ92108.1 lysostaphin [Crocosphaera chwakensis CCY0110]